MLELKTSNEDIIHIVIEKIKVLKQPFPSIGDLSLEITRTILILIYFFRSQDSGFSDSGDDQTDIIEEITNNIEDLEQDESNVNLDNGTYHENDHDSQNYGSRDTGDTGSEIKKDPKIENKESEKDVLQGEIVLDDLKDDVNEENHYGDDFNKDDDHEFRIMNINENEYEKVFN